MSGDDERRLRRFTSRVRASMRYVAQRGMLKPLVWSLVRVTVIGRAAAKGASKPFIVVANHASHLDAPLIIGALPARQARYLACGAAADYFFDVWWRRGLTSLFFNAFPVDRGGPGRRGIRARHLVDRGIPLLIFPEGTRSPDGRLGDFKPGAAGVAVKAGVPCLPVALVGTAEAHPRGTNWPKRGRPAVTVVFGEPISVRAGETPAELTARLRAEIGRLHSSHVARALGPSASDRGAAA